MSHYHHNTIRKYTSALLNFFGNVDVEYNISTSETRSQNVPVKFSTKEKYHLLDGLTDESIQSGNLNVLPRAALSLSGMLIDRERPQNKNLKVNKVSGADTVDYMFNSQPYIFNFEYSVICRGMNEVTQIIEQVATQFNPTLNIDVWDASNLSEPTRVPIRLLDVGFETPEYDDFSSNLFTVNFGLELYGNIYPPIRTAARVKEFKAFINEIKDDETGSFADRSTIINWDVGATGKVENPENPEIVNVHDIDTYPPQIISLNSISPVIVGENNLVVIYEDKDNKLTELTFDWVVLQGDATVQSDLDNAVLTVNTSGNVEVQVTITDIYGNFSSISRIWTVV